jgi:hypothetical protein
MPFTKEIEELTRELERIIQSFNEAKLEFVLPVSFFSTTNDQLDQVKERLCRLEETQQALLKKEAEAKEEIKEDPAPIIEEKKMPEPPKSEVQYLEAEIAKQIYSDFGKALSLNDRFRFQRDLFGHNTKLMEQTLDHLNTLNSYQEVMDYLSSEFNWGWNGESTVSFHELLVKRFA